MAFNKLDARIRFIWEALGEKTLDFDNATDPVTIDDDVRMSVGTGANQADQSWRDQRALAASSNDDLDLAGVLTNAFGETVTFVLVKGLYVRNNDTVTTLSIGNGANPWLTMFGAGTHSLVLRPGGRFMIVASGATAYAVTAGTGDILRIARGAGSVTDNTYDIAILGATA